MPGVVVFLDKSDNWGYILGYDDIKYYFSFSSVNFLESYLKEKLEVKFEPVVIDSVPCAFDVILDN